MSDIQTLMEVTGLTRAAAQRVLTVSNNNLERAINFHLEGNTIDEPVAAPIDDDDAVAAAGAPSMPPLGDEARTDDPALMAAAADDDDDVRAPIPVRREQMVQPEDDQFRMRVRRPFATPFGVHNVCPLRNFQLEGELQEQQLYEAAGVVAAAAPDPMGFGAVAALMPRAANMVAAARAAAAEAGRGGGLRRPSKRSRLGDLFRPPVDLSVVGSLQTIKDTAKQRNRWVIVNLQDNADFASQVLNRDVWSDGALRAMIGRYFVFWQIAVDMPEGARFQSFYGARQLPYVCIIDPQTGEEKCNYKSDTTTTATTSTPSGTVGGSTSASRSTPQVSSPFRYNATQFLAELRAFLQTHGVSPDPTVAADIDDADLIADNLTASGDAAAAQAVRRSELSEDEQLRLAIENSLRESQAAEAAAAGGSGRRSSTSRSTSSSPARKVAKVMAVLDSDDDDTDVDTFDDEATAAAAATSAAANGKTAAVRRPPSNDDNEVAFIPVDLPSQYARHLGDSSDPITKLQLRLPDGRRENLEWPCSSRIRALRLYVEHVYPEVTRLPYKLLCPYPRKDLLELDGGETLLGAKLHPSVLLHVHQDD